MTSDLLSDFANNRWDSMPFERLFRLLRSRPTAADEFAELGLAQAPKGGAFFDLTLSFVSESGFNELISTALRNLAVNPRREADSALVAYASLQFPRLLHPHLEQVFALRTNEGTYYENWPWRDSEGMAVRHLVEVIARAGPAERLKAWRCLLESRYTPALEHAIRTASSVPITHPVETYFHEVGFEAPSAALCTSSPSHVVFPGDHFIDRKPPWQDGSLHPTWRLGSASRSCTFGGYADAPCSLCSGRLHHLISIDLATLGMPAAYEPVAFAACLSCLGDERPILHYSHDEAGRPRALDTGRTSPRYPAVALKESEVHVVASPARWRWQDWGLANGRENLNRVGGHPSWIQSAEYPSCPSCERLMHFAFQLDSGLPTLDGNEWLWGSGGLCYAFWCRGCRVSAIFWQCT